MEYTYIWMPQSLSRLTLIIFNMELTHFSSEASIYFHTHPFKQKDNTKKKNLKKEKNSFQSPVT